MGKFGAPAANGACPAYAGAPASRSTAERSRRRVFMGASLICDGVGFGLFTGWGCEEAAHISDLLPLLDDDRLSKTLEFFIVSVLQQHQRHIDRALMVR